ncbi:MAG TPA: hypothetical protein VFP72_08855 [Kineosporiaceae bacterium]|nr:hypothetical protein [Kineosporiaceae bacterium]
MPPTSKAPRGRTNKATTEAEQQPPQDGTSAGPNTSPADADADTGQQADATTVDQPAREDEPSKPSAVGEVSAAPLAPPPVVQAKNGMQAPLHGAMPGTVGLELARSRPTDLIVDAETGEPPTDLDALFETVTPQGSAVRCTRRLLQKVQMGQAGGNSTIVLMPRGRVVERIHADELLALLRAQAAQLQA